MTQLHFTYHNGAGECTLNLDYIFQRSMRDGKFVNTNKAYINEILRFVRDFAGIEKIEFLMDWLEKHDCKDLADNFRKKNAGIFK